MRRALLLVLFAGCASQPIATGEQDAYFICPGIIVDGASENLQRAGYITNWRGGTESIETKWTAYHLNIGEDRRTMILRLVVSAANQGVQFAILERSDDARGEAPWGRITRAQVESPGLSGLLEKIRRDVCGTEDPFFTATSPAG